MSDKRVAALKVRRDRFFSRIKITHQLIPFLKTDEKKRETFFSRYDKVSEWLQEIESLHNEIENLLIESDKAGDCLEITQVSEELDVLYFEIASEKKRHENLNIKLDSSSVNNVNNLKLPAIQITPFDSNVKNWHTFHALFSSLVHDNANYTDIEKFHHLISLLRGSALNLVKALPLVADNYIIAWNILLQKYEDSRLLFTFYVDEMMNFKPLPNESINGLTNLLNTFQENLSALNAMKHENLLSKFIAHIIVRCLDQDTRRQFETSLARTQLPETSQLFEFLNNQIRILEASNSLSTNVPKNKASVARKSLLTANPSFNVCAVCSGKHTIYKCEKFLEMSPFERKDCMKQLNRCFNCLKVHKLGECKSLSNCKICNKRHHSMLHFDSLSSGSKLTNTSLTAVTRSSGNMVQKVPKVLLGTAIVHMQNKYGAYVPTRIVIDNGSQVSLITQGCAKRLGLSVNKYKIPLDGLGQTAVNSCTGITSCVIKPVKQQAPMLSATPLVIQEITSWMPHVALDKSVKSRFSNISLADPSFDQPGQIDFLLGADMYPNILDVHSRILRGNPSALNTIFGYIILGEVGGQSTDSSPTSLLTLSDISLNETMRKFWEIEEAPVVSILNPENTIAEEMFQKEHYRQTDGRYVVPILLKSNSPPPQNTYSLAESRMRKLEKRFSKDATLASNYRDFLHEYENLDHMKCVEPHSGANYLPHHAVINGKGKIRVVFDGSAKTSGMSLNDMLYNGPKLQTEIPYMILNFRFHKIVFTADICKMYRQILIIPEHRKYQHILWRNSPSKPMKDYQLQTITYGLTSSPFLAISTLRQLARDEKEKYPAASKALLENFYVDDLATGTDSIESARHLKEEIVAILKSAKLELSKWASNRSELLEHDSQQQLLNFDKIQTNVKILGMYWNPELDYFSYHISIPNLTICSTRHILSTLVRIYDPLGWLSPVIFTAKRIIQELWKLNVDWDVEVPPHILSTWNSFVEQLPLLRHLQIPRYYHTNLDSHCILVGFCDASQLGYAAVTYLIVQNNSSSHLLMAKSKVAPLKSLTVPRLELCAAVLLSKLIKYILSSVHFATQIKKVILFTDSTIVLSWLQTPPHMLKTFVANRVIQILDNTPRAIWHHVTSEDNSADYGSRGTLPAQFTEHPSWLSGPPWLRDPFEVWPTTRPPSIPASELPEIQSPKPTVFSVELKSSYIIAKYSSLSKLKKVMAWILRFKTNCLSGISKTANQVLGRAGLTIQELDTALLKIIKLEQEVYFHEDLTLLTSNKICSSGLQKLKPFIDPQGILRVGGRLINSALPPEGKHPVLLPKSSHLTGLLIDHYHLSYLHVGPRTLQFLIQRKYWIMSGRTVIRSRLSKCITCHKFRATAYPPMMADLPSSRVQPSRPFSRVGVDFGGPFMLKDHKRRGAKTTKAYLCLFICMATKALHLEVVSDLSTDAFIAALTRFTNRRGLCFEVFSDCGTNFVGTKRYLTGVFKYFYSSPQREVITDYLTQRGILWTFNPSASPHFGGLWESGIKSVKHHLVRVVGDTSLTFEEFATLLTTIEAILNSRPLCPLSVDPENVDALTPGHFLIGGFLLGLPEYDLSDIGSNRLSRWQHIQKMSQHFWRRWNVEYLNTLQQRAKWLSDRPNLEIGQLVLIKDERLPSMRWALGRIIAVHPGKDDIVRVATIKTNKGIFVRPTVKLCPLPIN